MFLPSPPVTEGDARLFSLSLIPGLGAIDLTATAPVGKTNNTLNIG